MEESMRRIGIVMILTLVGCASSGGDGVDTGQDQNLNECTYGTRGFDCRAKNAMCSQKCFSVDESERAYVKLVVDGKTLDSRDVPFTPVHDLDHVLVYGCTLYDSPDNTHQSLDIEFKRNLQSAAADRRSDFEDYVNVAIDVFKGPGSYKADPTYIASDEAQAAGKIYAHAGGCSVAVSADDEGGLKGAIACASLESPDGTTTSLTGDFACPGTSLAPIFSRLP
jgi:hypothetical protein